MTAMLCKNLQQSISKEINYIKMLLPFTSNLSASKGGWNNIVETDGSVPCEPHWGWHNGDGMMVDKLVAINFLSWQPMDGLKKVQTMKILGLCPANERCYKVTSSLIGLAWT